MTVSLYNKDLLKARMGFILKLKIKVKGNKR